MKKRIISLALCLCLLLPMGSAMAAGSANDPLISISYINGTFIPGMMSAVKAMLNKAIEEHLSASEVPVTGMLSESLPAGSTVALRTGQTVILLSGSARFDIASGSIVNASLGLPAKSGGVNQSQRYIVCEDSAVTLSVTADATVYVSASAEISKAVYSPFSDVSYSQWWFEDILKAYERGLVNGMTDGSFNPRGELSLAQALKLAACMHQLYHEGKVSLQNSASGPWYQSYVDYCLKKGIISGGFDSYSDIVTRRQFVEIFHASLPKSDYVAINSIPAGSIGDIGGSGGWTDKVYDFYRAGILTGYTAGNGHEAHDFGPYSSITRAEVATIMNRMFDHGARVSFSIG